MLRIALRDLVVAIRGLRRDPTFTFVAVLALALGIGANSAVSSVVSAIINFPMPVADPHRTVFIWQTNEEQGFSQVPVSIDEYLDWKDRATSFDAMSLAVPAAFNVAGPTTPMRLSGARLEAGFFQQMGFPLTQGRGFLPEENEPGGAGVVVGQSRLLAAASGWRRRRW